MRGRDQGVWLPAAFPVLELCLAGGRCSGVTEEGDSCPGGGEEGTGYVMASYHLQAFFAHFTLLPLLS